jgi:hypothetical protein
MGAVIIKDVSTTWSWFFITDEISNAAVANSIVHINRVSQMAIAWRRSGLLLCRGLLIGFSSLPSRV